MGKWLRRVRGALLMGLIWAVVWAPVAVLIGLAVDPDGSMDEMWVAIGAYPGFLGGVVFSMVLAIAAGRRRLEELSIGRFAAWGAVAGLVVGAFPFFASVTTNDSPRWLLGGIILTAISLLSAASAAGSLALARRAGSAPLGSGARGELAAGQGAVPIDAGRARAAETPGADHVRTRGEGPGSSSPRTG